MADDIHCLIHENFAGNLRKCRRRNCYGIADHNLPGSYCSCKCGRDDLADGQTCLLQGCNNEADDGEETCIICLPFTAHCRRHACDGRVREHGQYCSNLCADATPCSMPGCRNMRVSDKGTCFACEWRQEFHRMAENAQHPPDGPFTMYEIPPWSTVPKPMHLGADWYRPWDEGNNMISIWQGSAEHLQCDLMLLWVPARGTGTMALHVQESESLGFTVGGAATQPGAMSIGRPVSAAAAYVCGMVGPIDPVDDVTSASAVHRMTKLFLDFVATRARERNLDTVCLCYDSVRLWKSGDEDGTAIPIMSAIREWLQDNSGSLQRIVVATRHGITFAVLTRATLMCFPPAVVLPVIADKRSDNAKLDRPPKRRPDNNVRIDKRARDQPKPTVRIDTGSGIQPGAMERTRSPYRERKVLVPTIRCDDISGRDVPMLPLGGGALKALLFVTFEEI